MKSILLFALYSFLYTTHIFSASHLQDDLKNPTNDDIRHIIKYAEQLRDSSYAVSIKTGKKAISLAIEREEVNILADSYKSLGVTYYYQGAFDSSHYYYEKALEQFKIVGDSLNIGKITGNFGIIYRRTGKYDKALQQYLKAIEIYQRLDYKSGLAGIYLNIGGVYQTLEDKEKALNFYRKAQDIFITLKDKHRLSRVLTNIGVIKFEQGLFRESLNVQLQALKINDDSGMLQHKGIIHLNLGQSYQALGEPIKALEHCNLCEEIRLQLNDIWGLGKLYLLKAEILKSLEKYNDSEAYYIKAEETCASNDLIADLKETYYRYSLFLEEQRQFEKSISYLKKHNQLKDSLLESYRSEIVAELTTKYESVQQEKELELLQQKSQIQDLKLGEKNAWIITLAVVLLLGAIAIIVSLRINRLSVAHKIMDLRQKVLLSQMNPHFLFNSLTAIQSFILDERNDEANNYLSRLATLVRGILENSREEFVSLRTELETLADYISLQKLRFENDITYQFEIDENIDQDEIVVPPMLAQPFVENALIHGGLRNMTDAKIEVKVSLSKNKEQVRFQIVDNGIGIEEAKKQNIEKKTHKSLATSIALDRVKIYNFKSSKKMHFDLIDLKTIQEDKRGTLVTYTIPLQVYKD